jgi:hypothetical protein
MSLIIIQTKIGAVNQVSTEEVSNDAKEDGHHRMRRSFDTCDVNPNTFLVLETVATWQRHRGDCDCD